MKCKILIPNCLSLLYNTFFIVLQVLSGGDSKAKKVNLRNALHPSIAKSIDIIKESFERLCLQDQDILGDSSSWNKVIKGLK